MVSLKRNVLFIDDCLGDTDIVRYNYLADDLKKNNDKYAQYEISFYFVESIDEAKKKLLEEQLVVDAIVCDYNFNNASPSENGIGLIKYIRQNINKRCKIIFYTMNGVCNIDQYELIDLINNDVYKLVDKGREGDEYLLDVLFQSFIDGDILVASLERFWIEYGKALSDESYTILDYDLDFKEIIKHIRLDDEIGRVLVEKFMYKALLESVSI